MKKIHTEFVAAWNDWTGNVCVSLDDYDKLSDELAAAKEQIKRLLAIETAAIDLNQYLQKTVGSTDAHEVSIVGTDVGAEGVRVRLDALCKTIKAKL